MKNLSLKTVLAAAVLCGAALSATPAHAIAYYDDYGRAYYYNTWGQRVYYDTGYNRPAVVDEGTRYHYYYPDRTQTTYVDEQPGKTVTTTVSQPAQTCRSFDHTIQVNGELHSMTGTECMQSDGNWVEQ